MISKPFDGGASSVRFMFVCVCVVLTVLGILAMIFFFYYLFTSAVAARMCCFNSLLVTFQYNRLHQKKQKQL